MDRIEKLKNDVYSFEELDTLEKNATKLNDLQTLDLIAISRLSKIAKGEQPTKEKNGGATPSRSQTRSRRGR
ncbi:MAG: hypothetical protein P8L39_03090 [Halioglobus sp.]|nr:hypothetical protein [Halioglobus sp.]